MRGFKSIKTRWLSVPPVTIGKPLCVKRVLNALALLMTEVAQSLKFWVRASWKEIARVVALYGFWNIELRDNFARSCGWFVIVKLPKGPLKDSWVDVVTI